MDLRLRASLSLALLLVLTVAGAWFIAGGRVLRPLIGGLVQERAELAAYIAREAEAAPDARARVRQLSKELGVKVGLRPEPPPGLQTNGRMELVQGREVWLRSGRRAPVAVSVRGRDGEEAWLLVRFPVELREATGKVRVGLALLLLVAVMAGVGMVRWVLRPLDVAGGAMRRVADGELGHRVPEGGDAAGQMGATFNRMAERVEGLVRGQRELMAAVSHELRTPLTRMRLQTELLRDAGADPGRLDALERDIAEVNGLVEELLESARLDQGAVALRPTSISPALLWAEALGAVDLGTREVSLKVDDALRIQADRGRLLRVCTNLLSNIVRYTPESARIGVHADAASDRDVVEMWVEDDGPGVPVDLLDRLFDPFVRAETSRARATGGLGLGLMLVRQVVEAHGGRVLAELRDSGGLRVRLWLPVLGPAANPPDA